jgi:hypothetical protein
MLPKKHLLGADKKRKRQGEIIESQRGALHKFFSSSSNIDFNEDQEQESDLGNKYDSNLNEDGKVNEPNPVK